MAKAKRKTMPAKGRPVPSGHDLAADALQYQGAGYAWGGSASSPGDWDCSSFVSYVLGHDFGLDLPGGGTFGDSGYPPNSHGPNVAAYVSWNGATTLGRNEAIQAGDLICWVPDGHIGIAISGTEMFSALDTSLGSIASPIRGWGPTNNYIARRLNGVGQTPTGAGGTGSPGNGGGGLGDVITSLLAPVAAGFAVGGVVLVAAVGVVIVAGIAVSAVLGSVLAKAAGGE